MPAPVAESAIVARVLERLAGMRAAMPLASAVAKALGIDMEALQDILADLDAAGLVEPFDGPRGLAVALTPLAAERAGLTLVERDGMRRWAKAEARQPKVKAKSRTGEVRASTLMDGDDGDYFDRLEDPDATEPVEDAITGEDLDDQFVARSMPRVGNKPRDPIVPAVRLVLGIRPQWHGPGEPSGPCRGCGGRELAITAYCCLCDRCGADHLLPRVSKPRATPVATPSAKLAGGTARKGPASPAKGRVAKKRGPAAAKAKKVRNGA